MIRINSLCKCGCSLLILSIFFFGCSENKKDLIDNTSYLPEQSLENFTFIATESGKKQWRLSAYKAESYLEKEKTFVYKLKMKFFEDNKQTSVLTADEGVLDHKTDNIKLKGNVKLSSLKQRVDIFTDEILWDATKKLILSDSFVREEREDIIVTGKGLEADPNLERIVIKENVKAIKKKW